METDATPADMPTATESAHTSSRKSAPMSRMELITRRERRRRWTTEQKQTIAAQSLAPGASPTEVARQHGISTGQLYTWRHALMASQPGAVTRTPMRFVQVDVAPGPLTHRSDSPGVAAHVGATARSPGLVEIGLPDGTTVRVDAEIDPLVLRRVLTAVRG